MCVCFSFCYNRPDVTLKFLNRLDDDLPWAMDNVLVE